MNKKQTYFLNFRGDDEKDGEPVNTGSGYETKEEAYKDYKILKGENKGCNYQLVNDDTLYCEEINEEALEIIDEQGGYHTDVDDLIHYLNRGVLVGKKGDLLIDIDKNDIITKIERADNGVVLFGEGK